MNKKQAVALEYNEEKGKSVPKIIAVGEGYIAEKIIALARENNVPLYEDIEVVQKLVRFPPGTEIPPQLYEAVAKIIAYLYQLENQKKEQKNTKV